MNWLKTSLLLIAAFLAVFWEAAFGVVRHLLGAQIDLLPPLLVYAGLSTGWISICLLSFVGGLLFDSLSANPLGVSVLPLLAVGSLIYLLREFVLRDQTLTHLVLGLFASAAAPVLTLILLLTTGHGPMLGWGTLWQLTVMTLGGGLVAPLVFALFDWLHGALIHARTAETSFRPDREIRRGRS
ncbi:MAG TPA: hypothetical protein VG146_06605 [Verrucomicrobiae bacterium]|nr:hypothetical protein [Verrucomicrobiae bacterium]